MIPYGRHSISEADIIAVTNSLRSEWLTTGPLVEKFELDLENLVGAQCAVVSSGTAALHCAYKAIGVEPGDEIITPPITFIATQATAALMGANIVFADVQEGTANIDPKAVQAAITPRTKAIVAVDFAGHPADIDELRKIANENRIFLIEDAAHSLGSLYKTKVVGSLADITTFSFFPTKNITSGEGGAIASTNSELLEKARIFSKQGLIRNPKNFKILNQGSWHQEVHDFGLNYRLSDIHCALGISQLSRIQSMKTARKEIFDYYKEGFQNNFNILLPEVRDYVEPNWHLYPIRVEPSRRREIFDALKLAGIGVQVNYLPAHLHPVLANLGFRTGQFPVSEAFYNEEISLPIHLELTIKDLDFIIKTVNSVSR